MPVSFEISHPASPEFDMRIQNVSVLLEFLQRFQIANRPTVLNVFFTRALSERLAGKRVIVNCVNPGYCYSNLRGQFKGLRAVVDWIMERMIARTAEEGSRQLVWAAIGEPENPNDLRGAYISLAQVTEASDYVIDEDGQKVENKLWVRFACPYFYTPLLNISYRIF